MLMLKEILAARKMKIASLVRLSGVSRRTIEEILRRGDCRISTARLLCDALECPLDEFFTSDPKEPE